MKSVYSALEPIVNGSLTQKEKGTKYEAACVYYLQNDPFYRDFFSRVGTLEQALGWTGCPVRDTKDTGIDLMAQEAQSGLWWAIQCKCYDGDKPLPKGVCDSFFAYALTQSGVDNLMVMTSAAAPGANLQKQLDGSHCMLVNTAKMASSNIDWEPFINGTPAKERVTYDPRPHQQEAIDCIEAAWADHDRCKAIMACGTGKTLMSLCLVEDWMQDGPGTVLFCAPSISLVGQSMREWMAQSRVPLSPLVVCSDSKASRKDDVIPMTLDAFEYPATTDANSLWHSYEASRDANPGGLVVIFSTYQSIDVVRAAQALGIPDFEVIVCDEAHRTTGNALPGVSKTEASAFMKVHFNENVRAKKRLYMTATPRIYGETAKRKGAEEDYTIASMDDESIYGPTAYQIKFGEAVEKKLLTDYKVLVLTVQEDAIGDRLPSLEGDQGVNAVTLEPSDIGKIVGCWKGLVDHGEAAPEDATGLGNMLVVDDVDRLDPEATPLHRAVGFCSTINASKTIAEAFSQIVEKYTEEDPGELPLRCELDHVDGSMPSDARARKIAWLGEDVADDECRILTNARCLAEGVDVPSLDAVIFFSPKRSKVDVVQAVGRVMRTFHKGQPDEKKLGYIILPVAIPSEMTPEEALNQSDSFDVVWGVLQALRSHDQRIDAYINSLPMRKPRKKGKGLGIGGKSGVSDSEEAGGSRAGDGAGAQTSLALDFGVTDLERAVYAKAVEKCGSKVYWSSWAEDVGRIAQAHVEQIEAAVAEDPVAADAMASFLGSLRDSLNPGITQQAAVEMVAQHMVTLPVFDALFGDYAFAQTNPVSVAITRFLDALRGHGIGDLSADDQRSLDELYRSVRRRASFCRTDSNRQALIKDLYNEFFSKAFTRTSEKLGIVYTPIQIVDYMLHATDRALQREFGRRLADEGVHILDPFSGTGSYMAQLVSDPELMPLDALPRKYVGELHSNEILLLAYYIMVVNVEYAYHSRVGGAYVPFGGGRSHGHIPDGREERRARPGHVRGQLRARLAPAGGPHHRRRGQPSLLRGTEERQR